MQDNQSFEEEEDELYEHYSFKAEKGQTPLRVDKYLMNFVETQLVIKFSRRQEQEIFM